MRKNNPHVIIYGTSGSMFKEEVKEFDAIKEATYPVI
jgi:hypothetical protein